MKMSLFPALPNSSEVRTLKEFCWEVQTGPALHVRHRLMDSPWVELQIPGDTGEPVWMGDIVSWPASGEFILAVNRGLVLCVKASRLCLRAKATGERLLRTTLPDGDVALISYEWEEELNFRPAGEGRLEVTGLSTELPVMLYLYVASPGDKETVTRRRLERLMKADLAALVRQVQNYQNTLPVWRSTPTLERLWNFVYHLHRVSTYEPEKPFGFEWECLGRASDYQRAVNGHWDTLHVVWDWLLVNPRRAREEFANYLRGFDEETGMMAMDVAPVGLDHWPAQVRKVSGGRNTSCSHPPVWPWVAWQLYLVLRDRDLLEETFRLGLKNLAWWEHNRDTDGDGLFEYADTGAVPVWESGMDGSVRFDGRTGKRFASVDLCCQLALFYRCMERFALELHESALATDLKGRWRKLARLVGEKMWEQKTGFFYDLRDADHVRVKTTAGFWSLLSEVADEKQTAALTRHLADEKEFLSTLPVPSVALDERAFEPVYWRGPTWISQTLWTVAGLRHNGQTQLAGEITRRALAGMADLLEREGTVYECYSPTGTDQDKVLIERDGKPVGRYYLGHAPVHALTALGLYGIQMTREGLVVDPVGRALPSESTIEVQLPEVRLAVTVKRTDDQDGIKLTVNAGKRQLAESFGRTVIGLGQLL